MKAHQNLTPQRQRVILVYMCTERSTEAYMLQELKKIFVVVE